MRRKNTNKKVKFSSNNLIEYLEQLVGDISGENLNAMGRALLILVKPHLVEDEWKKVELSLKHLRRSANVLKPPVHKAADALRLKDLYELLDRSESKKLNRLEHQAIDILVVAFASLSRVAEIVALTVRDVSSDGECISIRAKTQAATCRRHVKHISDGRGLYPVEILRKYRLEAALNGRKLLFSGQQGEDTYISSSEVTQALKRLTLKLGIACRITSHSGRKGAAVAALLSGVPLVVIQSLGLWQCIDSLQAYVGKTLRENFCVLDFLK